MSDEESESKERYCICRSTNSDGFMISCDRCEEWFHGNCVKLKKKESLHIEKWYCSACLKLDSRLSIVFKKGHPNHIENNKKKEKLDEAQKETIKSSHNEQRISLNATKNHTTLKGTKDKLLLNDRSSPARLPEIENTYQEAVQQENIPIYETVARKDRQASKNLNTDRSGSRRKRGTNLKESSHKRQCENPTCVREARKDSNYCSNECGLELAKKRLIRHFLPKWQEIKEAPTEIEKRFKKEMVELEESKRYHEEQVDDIIRRLEKLDQDINTIKDIVREKEHDERMQCDDEIEEDSEESEEITSAEVTKTYCVTCGMTISSENAFKHWANCFKKHESAFSVSSGCKCTFGPPDNPHPPIFCEHEDKKKQQFCKRFLGICVEHQDPELTGTKKDKDEICGCPIEIQQELVLDGNYCLEKKTDCTTHYLWDKFMKAQLNLLRLHHYFKLDEICEKMRVCSNNLENHYGGIIGLMLHTTKNELPQTDESYDDEIDIECTR